MGDLDSLRKEKMKAEADIESILNRIINKYDISIHNIYVDEEPGVVIGNGGDSGSRLVSVEIDIRINNG